METSLLGKFGIELLKKDEEESIPSAETHLSTAKTADYDDEEEERDI